VTPLEAARTFLGVKYHHQGRSRYGLDCSGLVVVAYRMAGYEIEDVNGYGREPWRDGLRAAVEKNFPVVVTDEGHPGDVILFRIKHEPQHLALQTETGMIHAYGVTGCVCEMGLDDRWTKRIIGRYRK
jgi:cell wall-associated NlpC family hydrolase